MTLCAVATRRPELWPLVVTLIVDLSILAMSLSATRDVGAPTGLRSHSRRHLRSPALLQCACYLPATAFLNAVAALKPGTVVAAI